MSSQADDDCSTPGLEPTRRPSSPLPSHDPYLQVPEGIRLRLTRKQWAFLTDGQRATLVRDFTEPDWIHDDA